MISIYKMIITLGVNYALRISLCYLMDIRNYQSSTAYGFWAPDLPTLWQPWPLLAEIILIKILEYNTYCVTSSLVGVVLGFMVAWILWYIPLNYWLNDDEDSDEDNRERELNEGTTTQVVSLQVSKTRLVRAHSPSAKSIMINKEGKGKDKKKVKVRHEEETVEVKIVTRQASLNLDENSIMELYLDRPPKSFIRKRRS